MFLQMLRFPSNLFLLALHIHNHLLPSPTIPSWPKEISYVFLITSLLLKPDLHCRLLWLYPLPPVLLRSHTSYTAAYLLSSLFLTIASVLLSHSYCASINSLPLCCLIASLQIASLLRPCPRVVGVPSYPLPVSCLPAASLMHIMFFLPHTVSSLTPSLPTPRCLTLLLDYWFSCLYLDFLQSLASPCSLALLLACWIIPIFNPTFGVPSVH